MTQYHESPETREANARQSDFSAAAQYAAQEAKAADPIEQEIQAKGLTAPRVTPNDIEANIAEEHYFTGDAGLDAVRFQWLLDDHRDPNERAAARALLERMPVISLSAARADIDHAMGRYNEQFSRSPSLLTFCVLVLNNGFTVTGESACASPENFDAELGRKIARQNAINKVWPLMGYELRSKLASGLTVSQ